MDSSQSSNIIYDGNRLINFSSNDYLGLASHPALKEAMLTAWDTGGFGSGASRLVCGTLAAHEELETTLAQFKRTEAALTFSSGYAAALGTIPALCGKNDVVILDKLSHACLVDAARLSGAHLRIFPHNDMEKLESHLQWASKKHPESRVIILAESVYSMDGDLAPLREIVDLKDRYGAWLFLDEAHGVGVIGAQGRGLADHLGIASRIEVQMGTLGKALGAHGAYIAGAHKLREFLINRARSFIYSTAPPAPTVAAATCGIKILQSSEGKDLLSKLWKNIQNLQHLLALENVSSAIMPWIIGSEPEAMTISTLLLKQGFLVPAIRFPTVAKGSARLRITLSALHTTSEIKTLGHALQKSE